MRQSTFPIYDRLVDGKLAKIIEEYRDHGKSWEFISRGLSAAYGIEVSSETVRRWFIQFEEVGS